MHGAGGFVMRESAVGLGALAFGDFQLVTQVHGGDAKEFVIGFDAAFDVGFEMVCCGDSTRFQRAGKCAGQSTSERGDDVIDGGGHRLAVFHAVILGVAAVRAEMQWLFESFNVRLAKGALLLHQPDSSRMNDFAHDGLLTREMSGDVESYSAKKIA
jgi:hypothetical protein